MEARLSGTSLSENMMIHLGLRPNNDSEILPRPLKKKKRRKCEKGIMDLR